MCTVELAIDPTAPPAVINCPSGTGSRTSVAVVNSSTPPAVINRPSSTLPVVVTSGRSVAASRRESRKQEGRHQ